jgi:RHS repeat-associated protein
LSPVAFLVTIPLAPPCHGHALPDALSGASVPCTARCGWPDGKDNSGNVQDTISYDAFGNASESNPSFGDCYKYTGRELDTATGLQYNRARYDDAAIGRWTSQDPLGFAAGETDLYRYVNNDPTGATDPRGLDFISLGDRAVDQLGAQLVSARHYSLDYFSTNGGPDPAGNNWYNFNNSAKQVGDAVDPGTGIVVYYLPPLQVKRLDALELYDDTSDWSIAVRAPHLPKNTGTGNVYQPVSVSFIFHTSNPEHIYNRFSDDSVGVSKAAVANMWSRLVKAAQSYEFAEQPSVNKSGTLQHWPNSEYPSLGYNGNNSNTFIRAIVSQAGLVFPPDYGNHPGNKTPQAVTPNSNWIGAPFRTP